eukprot:TRINITY_DN21879_c0_g2_i1.p1 TRINITY_DN21879_c0_g2~~TRINITY_DN21879_c0_g2_i1.p1  ORF type:complete len:288 (-),score=17.42 TRINITY_DN21879_c0_g2_i1:325-1188(-)
MATSAMHSGGLGDDGTGRVNGHIRRRKTARERKEQQLRSDARMMLRLVRGLMDVQSHRGSQLGLVGDKLRAALSPHAHMLATSADICKAPSEVDDHSALPATCNKGVPVACAVERSDNEHRHPTITLHGDWVPLPTFGAFAWHLPSVFHRSRCHGDSRDIAIQTDPVDSIEQAFAAYQRSAQEQFNAYEKQMGDMFSAVEALSAKLSVHARSAPLVQRGEHRLLLPCVSAACMLCNFHRLFSCHCLLRFCACAWQCARYKCLPPLHRDMIRRLSFCSLCCCVAVFLN